MSKTATTASLQDLVRELRKGGTVLLDRGSAESQAIAQDVFSELGSREKACGATQYPFKIEPHCIERKPDYLNSPYVFQLLLTHFGIVKSSGGDSPEKLFEEIAAHAAGKYFGGDDPPIAFGFPRRYQAKNFRTALDDLCRRLGEGEGASIPDGDKKRLAKLLEQKDGKLDIVAWRPFPDRRVGQLVGFGQCACGKTDWRTKFSELQPDSFFKLWLRKPFSVNPVRMFFVPRRVELDDWADVAIQAGVLFDRCRISHHAMGLSVETVKACKAWISYILKEQRKAGPSGSKPKGGARKAPDPKNANDKGDRAKRKLSQTSSGAAKTKPKKPKSANSAKKGKVTTKRTTTRGVR